MKAGGKKVTWSDEEGEAMKDYVKEKRGEGEGESAVLAKIETMKEPDGSLAKKLHGIIKASGPMLAPRLWYGMPAYSQPGKDGKVVCYFQAGSKFKTRYGTLGFSDKARLDEGEMWPVVWALKTLSSREEAAISALVKKAVA